MAVVLFLEIVAVVGLSSAKLINGARAAVDKPIQWLFNGPGVAAMAASAEASRILQSRRPFVMWGRSLTNVPPDWGAVPVISFKSFGAIKDALEMGTLGSEIKGVMYDYETWGFTPVEEQKDPAGYVKQATKLVHARGLLFLTAPAVNLAEVMEPNSSPAQRDQTYLRLGIAADAARYADVLDIQAQRFESDTQHYANFVQQAGNASAAGKSQCPSPRRNKRAAHRSASDRKCRAIAATRNVVDGYWFNSPEPIRVFSTRYRVPSRYRRRGSPTPCRTMII